MLGGNRRFPGTPPAKPAPIFMFIEPCRGDGTPAMVASPLALPLLDCEVSEGRWGMFMRCCCRARAFCMISIGRELALGGGRLALLRAPVTLDVDIRRVLFWGSEMVRREGTLRGCSLAPGGARPEPKGEGTTSEPELMGS